MGSKFSLNIHQLCWICPSTQGITKSKGIKATIKTPILLLHVRKSQGKLCSLMMQWLPSYILKTKVSGKFAFSKDCPALIKRPFNQPDERFRISKSEGSTFTPTIVATFHHLFHLHLNLTQNIHLSPCDHL